MSFYVLEYVHYSFEWKCNMLWCLVQLLKKMTLNFKSRIFGHFQHMIICTKWCDMMMKIFVDIYIWIKFMWLKFQSVSISIYFFKNPEPKLSLWKKYEKLVLWKQWPVRIQTCFWTFKWPNWVLAIRTCFVIDSILNNFVE